MAVPGLKPRRGIGSLFNHGYDRDRVIKDALKRLNKSAEVVVFANTEGWRLIRHEYQQLINQLKEHQLSLGHKASKNCEDIQGTHDFIRAMELLLMLTDNLIREHEQADRIITRNQQGTAQRTAG